MNRQWMRDHLTEYLVLAEKYCASDHLRHSLRKDTDSVAGELRKREPTVKEILKHVKPELATFDFEWVTGDTDARNAVQRGLGILDGMDEWAVNLAPDAPTLQADGFHPWVWGAASTFWESKHYRAAVDAAANSINAYTQTKTGRNDLFNIDLMNQAFTDKPKPGHTYLQLPGDQTDPTIKSRNRALRPFAEGCFAGIRNPAAHEHGTDWDEQKALEYLAALSVLARWIDVCAVKRAASS